MTQEGGAMQEFREGTMAELSEAFAPCTITGLAKRFWEINHEIGALRTERENLEAILLDHCTRTGEVIEVEGQPALRPFERVKLIGNGPRWEWETVLEFDRRKR